MRRQGRPGRKRKRERMDSDEAEGKRVKEGEVKERRL